MFDGVEPTGDVDLVDIGNGFYFISSQILWIVMTSLRTTLVCGRSDFLSPNMEKKL